ncbi:hypothetical protein D3C75_832990 [compost metagenome]
MTADSFGGRVNNNIRSMSKGIEQVRCAKSVVNDKWNTMFMRNLGDSFDIENGRIGITDALD